MIQVKSPVRQFAVAGQRAEQVVFKVFNKYV